MAVVEKGPDSMGSHSSSYSCALRELMKEGVILQPVRMYQVPKRRYPNLQPI